MIPETIVTEQNKETYRRFIDDIFNHGRLEKLDEFLLPSYTYRDAPPGSPSGPAIIPVVVKMFRAAFPDLHITIEDQVAEGDKVCSRTTTRGTHRGPLFGIPPSNKAIAMPGMTMVRFVDGRMEEGWVRNDTVMMLKQMGATSIPS